MLSYKGTYPSISDSAFIAQNSSIIGNVTIKDNASIWFGAVLRGDINKITIGKGSNVQDNCTVHITSTAETIIGNYVTIGHNAVVHGCNINNNCLIGMGSIILDGAEIGEYSIVGAGSLVTRNKKFPSGVLIMGSPAKIVRNLTEEEKDNIKQSALNYIEEAKEYKLLLSKNN